MIRVRAEVGKSSRCAADGVSPIGMGRTMSESTPEAKVMAAERFEGQLHDRLAALGKVTSRPMFGGLGFYWGETIFGIVYGDRTYFKVNERSKGDLKSMGPGSQKEGSGIIVKLDS